ncbi:MAG: Xaa-Pro peptidase family protein [Pseudomonadota bacterium]
MNVPRRGFEEAEFHQRLNRAQELMNAHGLDALLLTTEPEIRWFTGFLTQFWESPTRPWFLLAPASGKPVAIIPSIGAHLMGKSWIEDVRCWQAPNLTDDGVSLLSEAITEITGPSGRIGMPSGHETHIRMPANNLARLKERCPSTRFTDDHSIMAQLRMVKSYAEIEKIRYACDIGARTFARTETIKILGRRHDAIIRDFQILCLEEGADWVSYVASGFGQDGYEDVISPATSTVVVASDILMIDTGLVWDGYFCDFDRNFSVGQRPSLVVQDAWKKLREAVDAAVSAAKPGITAADLFETMRAIVSPDQEGSSTGRLGHGLGMQLTEWPSLMAGDETELTEGMVLTLEPGIETKDNHMLVHEENIVITAHGCELLTPLASDDIPVCDGNKP